MWCRIDVVGIIFAASKSVVVSAYTVGGSSSEWIDLAGGTQSEAPGGGGAASPPIPLTRYTYDICVHIMLPIAGAVNALA